MQVRIGLIERKLDNATKDGDDNIYNVYTTHNLYNYHCSSARGGE